MAAISALLNVGLGKTFNVIHGEDGQTLVEYGLIAVLVSLAAFIVLTAVGVSVEDLFGKVKGAFDSASS